jgi:hypothetical protein
VDRAATGITILKAAGISQALAPAVRSDVGEDENLARSISPNSSSLVSALTRAGTGPKSPSAAFPGAT